MHATKRTKETVIPATPSPGGVLELSNDDQIMPPFYTSILLFFPERPPADAPALLRSSLADALSLFYPLAGRYRERTNGELEIVCNDEGASLDEVWVDCGFDRFLPNFDPNPDFALFMPPFDITADKCQVPLLRVQITHFECGRICVGVGLHHHVCDGFSTSHFLSSWASLASRRLSKDSNAGSQPPILKPHLDRSALRANNPPCPTAEHPEYQTHKLDWSSTRSLSTSKIFHFSPASIDAFRARASRNSTVTYTRFEAIAALLWRGMTIARGLASDQEIRLGMSVDGRTRFTPPLPAGYFGNVSFCGYISCTARDVVESPASQAANVVKAAIAKVTDAHMRSALDWIAKQESLKAITPSYGRPSLDVMINSWSRFPLYDTDFGWGRPSFARTPVSAFDGLITLLPSPLGAGHVDAQVGMFAEHMPKFEQYLKQESLHCV